MNGALPELANLLTPEQAAKLLPFGNADWIRQRLRAGELHGYKVGGRWLVDPADVRQFVAEHSTTPPRRRPRRRRSITD